MSPSPRPITRHLVSLSSAVRMEISEGLAQRGHDLTLSVTHLVPALPLEGMGMTALATRVGQSVQRTGQLVQQLEEDGYVLREPDPQDGRAKRVVYTPRGQELLRDIDELTEQITKRFREALGAERFDRMHRDLADLDLAINGDRESVRVATAR